MANRTSAEIFGILFKMLAENPTPEHEKMAMRVCKMSRNYDFTSSQMWADDACLALGVARRGIDPDYPDEGEAVLWPGDMGYEKAERI